MFESETVWFLTYSKLRWTPDLTSADDEKVKSSSGWLAGFTVLILYILIRIYFTCHDGHYFSTLHKPFSLFSHSICDRLNLPSAHFLFFFSFCNHHHHHHSLLVTLCYPFQLSCLSRVFCCILWRNNPVRVCVCARVPSSSSPEFEVYSMLM